MIAESVIDYCIVCIKSHVRAGELCFVVREREFITWELKWKYVSFLFLRRHRARPKTHRSVRRFFLFLLDLTLTTLKVLNFVGIKFYQINYN